MNYAVVLEKEAAEFCASTSSHPFLFEMAPEEGRKIVNEVQNSPVYKYPAQIEDRKTDLGELGTINVRVLRPETVEKNPSVIFYIHGAGWVFGNAHTHDKLARELAARTGSIVVFPEYSLSPEAKYPTAINQCYAVLQKIANEGGKEGWNIKDLFVAGDSVGGNMAAVMAIMAKQKNGPKLKGQVLLYPVTNAGFETASYNEFATGYFLYKEGMQWFWNQYTASPSDRDEITASPLRASEEQLKNLPQALVITGEADVLRDEGEAYARKLLQAGVQVTAARFLGMSHDFCMLNILDQTMACRGAMNLATAWVRDRRQ